MCSGVVGCGIGGIGGAGVGYADYEIVVEVSVEVKEEPWVDEYIVAMEVIVPPVAV